MAAICASFARRRGSPTKFSCAAISSTRGAEWKSAARSSALSTEQTQEQDFKLTLAHEMVHTFAPPLDAPEGLLSSWYAEGLAVNYERVLPWRAHRISTADFLADLNKTAARYYTDRLNDTPNSQIPARFWADTRVRVLPYDRGSLYFAQLNAEMRRSTRRQALAR